MSKLDRDWMTLPDGSKIPRPKHTIVFPGDSPQQPDQGAAEDIQITVSFTQRQIEELEPGQNITLPLTDDARANIRQLLLQARKEECLINRKGVGLSKPYTADNLRDYFSNRLEELDQLTAQGGGTGE